MMRSFCAGSISEIHLGHAPDESRLREIVKIGPREQVAGLHPDLAAERLRDPSVVAGDDLERDAELTQVPDAVCDSLLNRIVEDQETEEGHPGLVVGDEAPVEACGSIGHGERP